MTGVLFFWEKYGFRMLLRELGDAFRVDVQFSGSLLKFYDMFSWRERESFRNTRVIVAKSDLKYRSRANIS